MRGFKDFILRGNVAALAVAFVIGGAFGALVQGFVKDFITPLIAIPGSGQNFEGYTFTIGHGTFQLRRLHRPRHRLPHRRRGHLLRARAADAASRGPSHDAGHPGDDAGVPGVPQQHPAGGAALRLLHRAGAPGRSRTDTVAGFKPAASAIGPRGQAEGTPGERRRPAAWPLPGCVKSSSRCSAAVPALNSTYMRSQAHSGLPVAPDVVARGLVMSVLEAGDDATDRRRLGQMLIDVLDDLAGLPPCAVVVADRAQVHEHDGRRLQSKTYGYYRCRFIDGAVTEARIRIYHRTAVRQQVISPKVFLNTLLHEWVHHYDFAGLRLARSPHTAGFYARLRALADALDVGFVLPPEPDDARSAAPRGVGRGRRRRRPVSST